MYSNKRVNKIIEKIAELEKTNSELAGKNTALEKEITNIKDSINKISSK